MLHCLQCAFSWSTPLASFDRVKLGRQSMAHAHKCQQVSPLVQLILIMLCRLCMGLYTETWSADNVTDDQVKRWMDKYHIHTVSTFLNHKDYRPGLSCKLSCTTSGLLKYGLSYHDLEWFSRGALVTAVLKVNTSHVLLSLCTKMMPTKSFLTNNMSCGSSNG